MPLYEYECTQCHRRLEKIQKFSDPELTVCPHCSGTLERTVTAPAIQFKGAGWYKDLYSSAKPQAAGETKTGDTAGSGASGDGASSGDKAGTAKSEGTRTETASTPAAGAASAPSAPTAGS